MMRLKPSLSVSLRALFCFFVFWSAVSLEAQDFQLDEATIGEAHEALASGDLTCRQLVEGYLARIEAYDKIGPAFNAIQTINPRALEEADGLDRTFAASGPVGPEFLGRAFTEEMLLRFGYAYEQATGHRSPPSTAPPLTTGRRPQ